MKVIEILDIDDCQSAIIGVVNPPKVSKDPYDGRQSIRSEAFVKLSDCSRWINWELFSSYRDDRKGYNLEKIDKAISILTKTRKEMAKQQKVYERMHKAVIKHNKAVTAKKKKDTSLDLTIDGSED